MPQSRPLARILALLVLLTLVSQFFRVAYGAIAPSLLREMNLSASTLSLAGAAFFLGLGVAQIPVGMAFDRFGVRRTVGVLTFAAVIGAVANAYARDGTELVLSRLVIGIGCGGSFMGAVFLCARWASPDRYAMVLSWVFSLSNLGSLFAGTPLAALIDGIGWRGSLLVIAAVAAVVGVLFYLFVSDNPPDAAPPPAQGDSPAAVLRGLAAVLKARGLAHVFAIHTVSYASIVTMLGLWTPPYLEHVHGFDAIARGNVILAMAVGQIIGITAYGPADRLLGSRKWVAVPAALLTAAVLGGLALVPPGAAWAAVVFLVGFCAVGAYSVIVVAHGRSLFPPELLGRGVTTVNLAQVAGCFLLPYLSGLLVQSIAPGGAPYPWFAYQMIFCFLAICLVCGASIFALGPDSRPQVARA